MQLTLVFLAAGLACALPLLVYLVALLRRERRVNREIAQMCQMYKVPAWPGDRDD